MIRNIILFLKKSLPFLCTLFLWRLSIYFWNPCGILALIPIFYWSFVKPIHMFSLFCLFMCFLIDYRCNLPLFWTCLYCLFYAVNGFQNYIDFQSTETKSRYAFMVFSGLGILILIFYGLTWKNFINNLWLFLWLNVLYIPITSLDKWAQNHDRH
nr:hypothetical protein [Candidatus Enterousia merdequi]